MILVYSCLFKVLVGYLGEQPGLFCGTDLILLGWSKPASAFQHSCDKRDMHVSRQWLRERVVGTLRVEYSVLGNHGRERRNTTLLTYRDPPPNRRPARL